MGTQKRFRDTELIEKAISGDRAAFDALTQRYLDKCYRIARRLGLSPEDAVDVVQDTFVAAYQNIERFDFAFQFSTWITRILLNRISNMWRGLGRARRLFFRSPIMEWEDFLGGARSADDPQRDFEQAELREYLQNAIDQLPEPQKTVLVLFDIEGFKAREIAVMLDIPEGTVTSRLHHARKRLRKLLRDYLS
ncbi:MAG: sigma-70 family RNA polymerase sigma factor [candidate division KSB1 bacterium]|nr:sigma-70 family RNA polymerase sigma factor [candidate division KSB1 bacterium]